MKTLNLPGPRKLYVETTTRCNMRCSMCVKQAEGACIGEQDMPFATFERLAPAFDGLDALILNGVGEPLLHSELERFAALARAAMPEKSWIGIQTNGLLMTESRAASLVGSGLDTYCISVDSLDSCEDELHGGDHIRQISRAFKALNSARSQGRVRLGVEFVLMRENFRDLPRTLEWGAEQGAEFALVTHMLPYAPDQADQELFNPNTEAAEARYEQWKAEAAEQGFNLADYMGKAWKFIKTDHERALVQFVSSRIRQALDEGVFMNLSELMLRDNPEARALYDEAREVLSETEAMAKRLGLELRLPPVNARAERRCEFMEEGVMHVTPQGEVRPCYFLWHEYACWMNHGLKKVRPVSFGNVLEDDPLEIWKSTPYAGFRKEVLDYDYPYCTNCSVVPCSDVRGDVPFDRDCYGSSVPCGHCTWCMGGVRCLL